MNLIEQLGGYRKASEVLKEYISNTLTPSQMGAKYGVWPFTIQILEEALLKYRRENNIFEIGDFVVNEIPETISALFQVETLTPKLKKPKTLRCGRWGNYPVGCNSVRHATPKEIAQGYRDE